MMSERDNTHILEPRAFAPGSPDPLVAPPMTKTLLARLFVVPAILVSMLVLGLMGVVILFGWPGIGQRPSVEQLMTDIEQVGAGERQLGVALLPRDKDVWLAAQELAERLKNPSKELKPDEVSPTSERLAKIFQRCTVGDTMTDEQ